MKFETSVKLRRELHLEMLYDIISGMFITERTFR